MMLERLLKRLVPARPPRPGLHLAEGQPAAPGAVPLNADLVDVRTLMPCTCGMDGVPDGWRHRYPSDGSGWLKAHPGCPRYRPPAAVPDERAVRERLRVAAATEEAAGVVAGPASMAYRQHMDRLLGWEGLGLPTHSEVAVLPARRRVDTGVLQASLPTPEQVANGTCGGPMEVHVHAQAGMAMTSEQLRHRLRLLADSRTMGALVLGDGANTTAAPPPANPDYKTSIPK